jgi:hypothetical protein
MAALVHVELVFLFAAMKIGKSANITSKQKQETLVFYTEVSLSNRQTIRIFEAQSTHGNNKRTRIQFQRRPNAAEVERA